MAGCRPRGLAHHLYGHLVAVDADSGFEPGLHAVLDHFVHPRMEVTILPKNYADIVEDLRRKSLGAFTLWLFDPYGLDSIPFYLVRSVLSDRRTEVIVNLDAGDALRVIDAGVKRLGSPNLGQVKSPTMDCLFGGDSWRDLPATLATTALREHWLADKYAALFPGSMQSQALPLESSTGYTRFLVQVASHPTASERFRASYDTVQQLWKAPGKARKVDEMARMIAHELAGQRVTPALIESLGLLPGVPVDRIRSALQYTLSLGLASACDPDGTATIRPRDDQPKAPPGLFF